MTDFILNQSTTYYRGAALTRVDPSQIAVLNDGYLGGTNTVLCVRSDGQIVKSSQALATPFNTFCVFSNAPPGEVWFRHVAADDLIISGALGDLVADVPPGAPTLMFSWNDNLNLLLFDGELLWRGRFDFGAAAYAYAPSNPTPVVAITAPERSIVFGTYIAADGKVYVGVITYIRNQGDHLAAKAFCTNPLTEISVDDAVWDGLSLTQIAAACDADPSSYAGVNYFGGYHRLTIVMEAAF